MESVTAARHLVLRGLSMLLVVEMALPWRSLVREPAGLLATFLSVAAISFASAQDAPSGAIDMARAELKYGHYDELRRLA
jgi:hypothetical protein